MMKFWFGKKDAEQEGNGGASCDVLTMPDPSRNGGVSLAATSHLYVAPQRAGAVAEPNVLVPQPVFSAGIGQQKPLPSSEAGDGVQGLKPSPVPLTMPAVSAEASKGLAKPAAAGLQPEAGAAGARETSALGAATPAEVQKAVLKPVGGALRMTARPVGDVAAAKPAMATAPLAGLGGGRPVYGLRAKAEPEPVTGVPSPVAEKSAIEREAEKLEMRPKLDQRALYYQLMNGLYDAVLILDDQGHVVDCNSRVTEMLGYSREDSWDLPIHKVITGMSSQMFDHLKRNLAENHHILIDARCFRQDGTSFAGEVGVSTLSLTRGANLVFTLRNVERRKSAMDELRKSHAALNISLAPSFVCDTEGFFLVVNQALLDAFGIPDEDQAKGVRLIDLLPDAARLFLRASCGEKLRETLRVPTPDGLPVKLQLALVPVQSGQNVTGVAGSILQM